LKINGENKMAIRKAERKKAKLRLGIAAPSGAGKTYSSLLLAFGMGGKIGLIDTEHGSGDLYADMGNYDIWSIAAPYTVDKYLEAIKAFEDEGYTTIIIDSLSHAWAGDGGLLDKQGKAADKSGNSWQAWRQVTPKHNKLVDAMLQSPCHIIATMRSKTEYVQEKDERTGKQVIRKVGMAPVMRDGIEYEFTVFLDIGMDHTAVTTKDRTRLFDGQYFAVTQKTGQQLLAWLETGAEVIAPKLDEGKKADLTDAIDNASDLDALFNAFSAAYRAASALADKDALADFTAAKDARKAAIEQVNAEGQKIADDVFGVPG
jgi:hypothetical protein